MTSDCEWTQEAFEASHTWRAWKYTPYEKGWDRCKNSPELRCAFEEEMHLEWVPEWATEIIDRMIASPLPPCGHYAFPRPITQICEAIGQQKCPDLVIGCYTADPEWKVLMSYYVFCLDAWLQQAPLDIARAELERRDDLGRDWNQIIEGVYETLGERTQQRVLLVRRLIHRLRWWLKTLVWQHDSRDKFMLDAYLGDVRGSGEWGEYGQRDLRDPYFTELKVPKMQELADQICSQVPNGKELLTHIEETWLCAPKVLRYLERLIIEVGSVGMDTPPNFGRSILQCEETYMDFASARGWYQSFMSSLTKWLCGHEEAVAELGPITPVKHWLARILHHRLELYGHWTRFLAGAPQGKSGTGEPRSG